MGNPARLLVVAMVLTGLLTTSCSVFGGGRSAQDEAGDLAKALSAGRLTGLRYDGGTAARAQALWKESVAGLGDSTPTVRVRSVRKQGDGPSIAALSWSWKLAGTTRRWTYDSRAVLTQDADHAWQVRLTPTLVHPALTSGGRLRLVHAFAPRADILGAGGSRLVTERPVLRFGVDKTKVGPGRQAAVARRLARAVDIDPGAYVARVRAAGPKAFVEAIVLRPADARPILNSGAAGAPGIEVIDGTLPLAPTRDFARAVLGTVGSVTADIVKQSRGVYAAGDVAGLSGLEARYDAQLRGTPGSTVSVVDRQGVARTLFTVKPRAGTPLRTTIAPKLQTEAERDLSDVRPASALVAIRPSTGDLLAVASGPGSAGQPTANLGQYAPGSTFKVVSSLALLRAGVRPSTTVSCPTATFVDGKRFKNYSDYPPGNLGRIPLSTAVASSCNTAFVNERTVVSQGDIAGAAAALGLGVDHDLGFPAFFGSVPASTADAGGATGHAASMIGQGRVVASPLAMATVAASVAHGRGVVPRLLPDHKSAAASVKTPLTSGEAAQLRLLMRGVVTRGSGSFLASVPGAPVLAKTGTAEFGTGTVLRTHAWMIAVHGDLAVAVFVDVGSSGAGTAGPILDRFLRAAS